MSRSRAVLAAAAVLLAWNVWSYDLWAPDEPYFGEGAREMIADGRWIVPHVNGEITTDKPPLFFWLIAWVSLPFGSVSSVTARIPSILAALGTIAITMRIGSRTAGPRVGVLAGVALATSYLFWDKGRTAQIDATLCLLVTGAVASFEAWRRGALEGGRAGRLFWGLAGLAVLSKGPVGVLLPLGIALVTLAWDRRVRDWRSFAPVSGPVVFLAVAGVWLVLLALGGDAGYSLSGAFRQHVLDRALHGMHHAQPPWYYAKVLPLQLFPWSALVPGAVVLAWRRRDDPAARLALVHALFVVAFFSCWTEKRDLYVLPAYPAFALLTARLLESREIDRRWMTAPLAITGALFLALGPLVVLAARRLAPAVVGAGVVPAIVLIVGGACVVSALWRRGAVPATAAVVGTAGAVYLAVATFVFPALNPAKSARALARDVVESTSSARAGGERVLAFGLGNLPEAIAFYTDGVYLLEVDSADDLARRLREGSSRWIVTDRRGFDALPDDLRSRATIVARHPFTRLEALVVTIGDAAPGENPERSTALRLR